MRTCYRFTMPFGVALIATGFLIPAAAIAQYDYYSSGSFGFNQNNYPDLSERKWKKPSTASTYKAPPRRQMEAPTAQPSGPTVFPERFLRNPLPYKRDMALAAKLRSEFLGNVGKGSSAASHANLKAMTTRNDFVQVFALMAKLQGLDTATVEGLTALWYGQAWAIANQRPLPTARQYQGIARQLRDTKANPLGWDKLNNSGRQTVVEMIAYPALVQRATYDDYRSSGDTAALARFADRVQAGMMKFNMNMQSLSLTDSGFQ